MTLCCVGWLLLIDDDEMMVFDRSFGASPLVKKNNNVAGALFSISSRKGSRACWCLANIPCTERLGA